MKEGCGVANSIRCQYHGWLYDQTGRLKATPHFGAAEDFDKAANSLFSFSVHNWRGLLFGNFAPAPASFETQYSDVLKIFKDVSFDGLTLARKATHDIACNWKTYAENYLEGYHIPLVHPTLSREVSLKDYRVVVNKNCVEHIAAPRSADGVYSGRWLFVAPNLALNFYSDGLTVERMLPTSPTTMQVEYWFFMKTGVSVALSEMNLAVTTEDKYICEAVQKNLEAGVYERGRLSPAHEEGVYFFQKWIDGELKAERAGDVCEGVPLL